MPNTTQPHSIKTGSFYSGWNLSHGIVKIHDPNLFREHSAAYAEGNTQAAERCQTIAQKADDLATEIYKATGEQVEIIIK